MERLLLPRPPKDLRVVELWGVNEALLHNKQLLSGAISQVIQEMNLHNVGEPLTFEFNPKGISYVQLLEESHLSGHTYYEKNGHFDMQVATCSEELDLSRLPETAYRIFRPKFGGICTLYPNPDLEKIAQLAQKSAYFAPIVIDQELIVYPIPPYGHPEGKMALQRL